jgi:hypothetical protein
MFISPPELLRLFDSAWKPEEGSCPGTVGQQRGSRPKRRCCSVGPQRPGSLPGHFRDGRAAPPGFARELEKSVTVHGNKQASVNAWTDHAMVCHPLERRHEIARSATGLGSQNPRMHFHVQGLLPALIAGAGGMIPVVKRQDELQILLSLSRGSRKQGECCKDDRSPSNPSPKRGRSHP